MYLSAQKYASRRDIYAVSQSGNNRTVTITLRIGSSMTIRRTVKYIFASVEHNKYIIVARLCSGDHDRFARPFFILLSLPH